MDTYTYYLIFVGVAILAITVFLVYYLFRGEKTVVTASPGPSDGSVITVSYHSDKGKSFNVTIRPDALSREAIARYHEEEEDLYRSIGEEPKEAALDFGRINDYINGRLSEEESARMRSSIMAVAELFRPVLQSVPQEERFVETKSRPAAAPAAEEAQVVADEGKGYDEEALVAALQEPGYDDVLAVYVADRLGFSSRVRRILPDDDEVQERLQMYTEEFASMDDADLAAYALDKAPKVRRGYKAKKLEVEVRPRAAGGRGRRQREDSSAASLFNMPEEPAVAQ